MKRFFIFFALMVATVVAAQAQGPRFGFRAGVNYSGISGSNIDDLDRIYGFHAGVTSRFIVTPDSFLTIQPEILYSQRGAEREDSNFELKLGYIDVPVLARINAGPIYFEGGPQLSVRVRDELTADRDDVINSEELLRSTAFGYVAGVGFSATQLGLSIGVRYNGEISQLNNNDDIPNIRSDLFQLTLSYLFPGRKRQPVETEVETEYEQDLP
ncbi:porin family protein [Pontibacter pamirensis]|uniref:porin family protein n=1 Tax=Pontibacter pamirensis TaxID=2562824 RepID=UPI001389A474|nr:porin family protein [Pontibacter pamirensis]